MPGEPMPAPDACGAIGDAPSGLVPAGRPNCDRKSSATSRSMPAPTSRPATAPGNRAPEASPSAPPRARPRAAPTRARTAPAAPPAAGPCSRSYRSPRRPPDEPPTRSTAPARTGWSMRSDPSPAPNRSSTTSAGTPTGSPSATSACALHDDSVRFRYTDYRRAGASRKKTMTLTVTEFIRRMLLQVLPPGFHRIRHYGFLANRNRQQKLADCRRLLRTPPPAEQAGPDGTDYRDRYEALTHPQAPAR